MSNVANGRTIVLFLGAGFSKDAGLPVMSEFADASKRDFDGLQKHASAPPEDVHYRHAARMLVDAGAVFSAFRTFCAKSGTLSPEALGNLETIFCIAEAMREAAIVKVEIAGQSYGMDQVVREMQIWTWKIYQQYPLTTRQVRKIAHPETFDRFFRTLKDSGILDRLVVITTNYDLVYECQAYMADVPCFYPLEQGRESNAGNDGRSRFCYVGPSDTGKVPVCKLHGSVNYFYDPVRDMQDAPFVFTDLAGDKPVGKSRLAPRVPAILAVDAIWNIREKLGGALTPAIIPPTYAKLTGQPWLRAIWNRAFQALANARKIVFIGYGMPDSDGFMRALVHGAMATRGSGSAPEIHVIDPSEDTRSRYEKLFLHGIRSWPKGLGDVTEGELQEIFRA